VTYCEQFLGEQGRVKTGFSIRHHWRCLWYRRQLRRSRRRLPMARDTLSVFCLYTELSTSFWMMDELTLVVRKRYHHDPSHPEQSEYRQPRASHGHKPAFVLPHTRHLRNALGTIAVEEPQSVRPRRSQQWVTRER